MNLTTRSLRRHQTGFSLIELMVGLAIGMLATIVIIQVMSVFEAQRRTTTGSADAQTNGGIALYSIAREVGMGGYPLLPVDSSALECTTVNVNAGATGISATLSPVTIVDGVATTTVSASDSITIRYGTSLLGGAITSTTGVVNAPNGVTVASNLGCELNDISLIVSGGTCNLSKVDSSWVKTAVDTSVKLVNTTGGTTANANLSCLGAWNEITYAVNSATGNLERTVRVNGTLSAPVPTVVGVVNLQAQYGISTTAASNQVTAWVDASGSTWAAPTIADRNRIKAIRIAVVARNAKMEPSDVAGACSSLTTTAPAGVCAWGGTTTSPAPAIDLSPGNANWTKYRYRVYETIIPLRNVIWSKDVL